MTIEDIVTLTKAGYTKEDIAGILASVNMPAAVPEVDTQEVQPEMSVQTDGTAPAAQEAPAAQPDVMADIQKLSTKVDYLVNRINLMNVRGSVLEDKPTESVDDILKSIIK